jgi:ferredoxin-NADP reductase
MHTTPKAGYVFPDFDTGNVLYATADTEILIGKDAAAILPKSNLAVKVTIKAARFVEKGLPFRGHRGDSSPYNPAVRFLTSEKAIPGANMLDNHSVSATLIKKDLITRLIGRFRFKISDTQAVGRWIPGQYATLSFQEELDMGYSHMRDDDPTSINDDYIRTFTVSSFPGRKIGDDEFEIIARKRGNATSHLFRSNERAGVGLGLKGFDGHFKIEQQQDDEHHVSPFIAGGIGITPVIAQLPGIDLARFRLFWSVTMQDIALVAEVFEEFPDLPKSTTLFITGPSEAEAALSTSDREKLEMVLGSEAKIHRRRLEAADLDLSTADKWYLCAGPGLKALVLNYLTGKTVVYEDFDY